MSAAPSNGPVLGRVATAMVSPMHADGSLDLDGAQRLARFLADNGTDTIVVNGTTGESPTTSADEKLELIRAVRDAVGDRAGVMAGTGTNDTAKTVAANEAATEAGADTILVVSPYYNRPGPRMLQAHFRAVATATDLPVVLYDVPSRTAGEITLPTIVQLAEVDNIAGIKDAAADLAKTAEIVAQTAGAPGGFDVYSGADEVNLPLLAVGGAGFVSVAAHLAGPLLAEMAEVFPTDPARARELHLALLPLCRALFVESSPAPIKGAMNDLGLPAGPVRKPLLDAEEATVKAVLHALDHAGIDRTTLGTA